MGRNIGTFLELEEIEALLSTANESFDKKFIELMFVGATTPQFFNAHVSMGSKKLPSVVYSVYNINGNIGAYCDNEMFENNCKILSNTIQSYIQNKNEKLK